MSSDCFDVRVKTVRGDTIELDVLTGTAGGLTDLCASRSFVLSVMHEALERADLALREGLTAAKRRAEAARLKKKHAASALTAALASEGDWYTSEPWMRANVGRFVRSCVLVERRNNLSDAVLSRREAAIVEEAGGALYLDKRTQWLPKRWAQCHNFTLRATLTDPKWGAHLEEGIEFGTTSYDVWFEGVAMASVAKAAKKSAAKRPTLKKISSKKPTLSAKSAAVKTAAKKAPSKKTSARAEPASKAGAAAKKASPKKTSSKKILSKKSAGR